LGRKKQVVYDESAIQTLDALEHIRLRSGMYIGRLGDGSHPLDGIYVMLKEVIDNSVDEFIMGSGKRIEISREDDTITVRDYGRGIPLGKLVDCVSQINTGGKYNDDVFQFSVGLNGVGTKAVNALSSSFEAASYRDGRYRRATFERGKILSDKKGRDPEAKSGTVVHFTPDPEIFGEFDWNEDFIGHRLPSTTWSTAARIASSSRSPTPTTTARTTTASSTASTPTTVAPTRAPSARAFSRVSTSSPRRASPGKTCATESWAPWR
jgi:topoisomerase-4 subunit B